MAASYLSRMLAMSGLPATLGETLLSGPICPWSFLVSYLLVAILLAMLAALTILAAMLAKPFPWQAIVVPFAPKTLTDSTFTDADTQSFIDTAMTAFLARCG